MGKDGEENCIFYETSLEIDTKNRRDLHLGGFVLIIHDIILACQARVLCSNPCHPLDQRADSSDRLYCFRFQVLSF